ncbi:MAG: PTS sugar transporter subunit IIA [Chloroherpetonaceae bacterium]|nr:PTS sugar transporter subunit IIA [Chloroherpetonaceae bacterium]MDW8437837.1 PTS sugar transporter subunit IIA [Chloroherpetonaceae bacterium]
MRLTEIISDKHIALGMEAKSKGDVIDKMLTLISSHPSVADAGKLRDDVWKREKEMSTGIGKKVALPHAKTNAVGAPVLAFATLKKAVEFESIDGEPVNIVFLLATPEAMLTQHLKLLSRISRLVAAEAVREKLVAAKEVSEVVELFKEEEKVYPDI